MRANASSGLVNAPTSMASTCPARPVRRSRTSRRTNARSSSWAAGGENSARRVNGSPNRVERWSRAGARGAGPAQRPACIRRRGRSGSRSSIQRPSTFQVVFRARTPAALCDSIAGTEVHAGTRRLPLGTSRPSILVCACSEGASTGDIQCPENRFDLRHAVNGNELVFCQRAGSGCRRYPPAGRPISA